MLLNFSNHPSAQWDDSQLLEAEKYGSVVDMPFPEIDPDWDENELDQLAQDYLLKINQLVLSRNSKTVIHLMGEYSFCFTMVYKLISQGIEVIVSTSKRQSVMNDDGTKTIRFNFVRFRKYKI